VPHTEGRRPVAGSDNRAVCCGSLVERRGRPTRQQCGGHHAGRQRRPSLKPGRLGNHRRADTPSWALLALARCGGRPGMGGWFGQRRSRVAIPARRCFFPCLDDAGCPFQPTRYQASGPCWRLRLVPRKVAARRLVSLAGSLSGGANGAIARSVVLLAYALLPAIHDPYSLT